MPQVWSQFYFILNQLGTTPTHYTFFTLQHNAHANSQLYFTKYQNAAFTWTASLPMPHICTWASHRTLLNCFYSNTIHSLKKYFLELHKENCKAQVKILDLSSKHIHITQQILTWHIMLMARHTISCLSSKLWELFGKTREVQIKSHPYKLVS